jgi:hypothetical protein
MHSSIGASTKISMNSPASSRFRAISRSERNGDPIRSSSAGATRLHNIAICPFNAGGPDYLKDARQDRRDPRGARLQWGFCQPSPAARRIDAEARLSGLTARSLGTPKNNIAIEDQCDDARGDVGE